MAPKPKVVPSRLGPPVQFSRLAYNQQQLNEKFQPKMREIMARQAKLIARWIHMNLTWKKILMTWMVVLIASKMVLLMLTYQFFTMTSLISLEIFHGVWTIAFFCLTIIDSRAILPNASCLLAGYLPATTVLHIMLIPNDYPLEYIITDAVGTFLAIITMFLLLRMECTEILHEAEELWEKQAYSDTRSESSRTSSTSSGGTCSNGRPMLSTMGTNRPLEINACHLMNNNLAGGRRIMGNPCGPTIINVGHSNGPNNMSMFDSMFNSMEESGEVAGSRNQVIFDEAVDLEPIDFEHFVDEPDLNQSERMFKVTFGQSPPMRSR